MMAVPVENKNNNKWIWIGLGAASLFCLCAVAVAVLVFMRVGQQFKEGMKTDPESASKAAHTIAEYELPEGYEEKIAMDFLVYTMVMMGPKSSSAPSSAARPMIMLAQFQVATNQQQIEEQMRRSFEQQSGRRGLKMEVVDVRKMTIRGEEVDVTTFEGKDDNGFVLRQLLATFPGKDGTALLMIIGSAQTWDKEEIDQFVESIH
jgi:hypothetical protein